jgi:hypothetical protein
MKSITRSCGVQVRDLNPKPCGAECVCVCVCVFAREVNTPCRRPLVLARSGRLGTEKSLYLHSASTCSLTGRARVHTHQQFLGYLPMRSFLEVLELDS